MHNLDSGCFECISDPTFDNTLIKVASTSMGDREITGPTVNCNSIADDEAIMPRPSGAVSFQMRIARFQVNGDLFGLS